MNNPFSTFKKRLIDAVLGQLTQGASADGLAKSCAAAVAFGVFPLLGFTTLLCLVFGAIFKLNQPILQVVNYLMMPVQLMAIPAFGYAGSYFFVTEPLDLNPTNLAREFAANSGLFFAKYGWVGIRAVLLWMIVAPILGFFVYRICLPIFKRMEKRTQNRRPEPSGESSK